MRTVAIAVAVAVSLAALPAAGQQFPINESFMNAVAPGWVMGAYAGSNFTPCLTSGNAACGNDSSGSGWLRLTNATVQTNGEAGFAYFDTAFPSTQGFAVDFEFVAWGGTGADGIGVVLFDGGVTQDTFRIGAPGGSFGYAADYNNSGCQFSATHLMGVHSGYLGFAIDEFGNFEYAGDRCKVGGPARMPESISLRGPGDGANDGTNYAYIDGTGTLTPGIDSPGGTTRPLPTAYYRRVIIYVTPNGTGGVDYTVSWKTSPTGAFTTILTGSIAAIVTPDSLKLGFSASTGGSTNYHEIRNVRVSYPADLQVTKAHSGTPAPGGATTYTMTVKNAGPVNVVGATFSDPFPAGVSVGSWTCSVTTGTGACTPASGTGSPINVSLDLNNGAIATITANATVALGVANTATVTPPANITDTNPNNNSATDTVGASADVGITKAPSSSSVQDNVDFLYTLNVTNYGPWPATNVTVTDPLPGTLTYRAITTTQGSCTTPAVGSNGTIICNLGEMSVNGAATIVVTARWPNRTTGTYTNTATVSLPDASEADPNAANNSASAAVTVTGGNPTVDLGVTKSHTGTPVPGSAVTYTCNVTTSAAVTGATFLDVVPPTISGVSWTCAGTNSGNCSPASGSGNTINPTVNLPNRNSTVAITISGTISATAVAPIVNTATITPPTGTDDTALANNVSSDIISNASVAVSKSASAATIIDGQDVTFTMSIGNPGSWPASNVVLTDTLAAGLTFVSATPGDCSAAGQVVTCALGQLAANGTATVTITARGTTTGAKTNTATVTHDNNVGVTSNSVTVTVTTGGDLSVTKTHYPATFNLGDAVRYTMTVLNTGPNTATGAQISDTVPAAITGVAWTCAGQGGGSCTPASGSGNTITPTVTLASGQGAVITVTGTLASNPGSVSNTVTVTPPAGFTDANVANNSATDNAPTTPVTVARFSAVPESGGVRFSWTSETEIANAGYNVYAQTGAGPVRLNAQLIPAHAGDSTTPVSYEYFAAGASAGSFFLEDVDLRACGRLHGPFLAGRAYGVAPTVDRIAWDAVRASHPAAPKPAAAVAAKASAADLLVEADGLYRVTYEALRAAGFDFAGVSASSLVVASRGTAVPILVLGANGSPGIAPSDRFGPGMAIEFYARAANSLYTRTNVYTLRTGAGGSRVVLDPTPPGNSAPPPYYLETQGVSKPVLYSFASPTGDPWYEAGLLAYTTPVHGTFTVGVDHLAPGADGARFWFEMWGGTDWPGVSPDHHAVLELNGATVADERFNGVVDYPVEGSVRAGSLVEGNNTFTLTLPGDSGAAYEIVNVAAYSITYPRQFVARSGRLEFRSAGRTLAVDGLASSDAVVYRMTGPVPQRLTQVAVAPGKSGLRARFAGSAGPARYVVYEASAILTPTIAAPRQTAGLTGGQVDYLIIAHPNFLSGLDALVRARTAQGLRVRVADVRDVYAAYGYGVVDPQAIHDYIAYAYRSMGTRYVLLVGGDTYDYLDYLRAGSISFIPTPYTATDELIKFAPADPLLADVNGDGVPDLALGRFPVRTPAELDTVIAKTLAYTARPNAAVFSADLADGGYSFKQLSESLVTSVPAGWSVTRAYADDLGVSNAKSVLVDAINQGVALTTYVGHSGFTRWSFSDIFDIDDAAALLNAGKPTVVAQVGCWNTYYVDPLANTLAHKLLLSGDRGAAAVLGPATLAESESEIALARLLFPLILRQGLPLGAALTQAKAQLALDRPATIDVLRSWTLLGDPALLIAPPSGARTQDIGQVGGHE